ncbi:hypothetical protein DCC39_17145 [Pueribacillus theae]|uniref:Uncharacterized protein n=1 Tax=Pueribacillus theae TaxID=2171751 RepID=A0A2U1JQ25_9BACI|nr:hypothetical protein DCC39_17145 [Pueribacillus theae]
MLMQTAPPFITLTVGRIINIILEVIEIAWTNNLRKAGIFLSKQISPVNAGPFSSVCPRILKKGMSYFDVRWRNLSVKH